MTNLTARRFDIDLRWKGTDGLVRGVASGRDFGVVNADGHWLSFHTDGQPSLWSRKSIAAEIAATLTDVEDQTFIRAWTR